MPANTYTLIEKIVVGAAGASSVTFTSIPQTYTDLKIVCSPRSTRTGFTNDSLLIQFNGSTSSYTYRNIYGTNGSAASVSGSTNQASYAVDAPSATANTFSNIELYIPNYTSSNNKSVSIDAVSEDNSGASIVELRALLWSNTAAITSIALLPETGPLFTQYSTFYLYGIAKEGVSPSPSSAPYATGGDRIVFDGTYWYHAFTSTGTFTPRKDLSCDVLVVAGGGSGAGSYGNQASGGGGAGGYQVFNSQTLTTTNYTVTIGGGGAGVPSSVLSSGNSGSNSQFGSLTASVGGGRGGAYAAGPAVGGSGGGGANQANITGANGTTGQGNKGGDGNAALNSGAGGGGGAGAVGGNQSSNNGGNGGAGSNSVSTWATATGTGVSGFYAGGGGGSRGGNGSVNGTGGSGGGGAAASLANATSGTANTGSGGGGVYGDVPYYTSGSGGSGIVIVRYAA